MTPRFFVLRWTPAQRALSERARAIAAKLNPDQWIKRLDWRGVLAFVHVDSVKDIIVLPAELGFIGGTLFRRDSGEPVKSFSSAETEALIMGGGGELFTAFWGPCCAILHNRGYDFFHALRDPAGSSPIYWYRSSQLHCVFSHAEDFLECWDEPPACDETMLSIYMVQPRIQTRRTAIEGVEELLPGERLTLGRTNEERSFVWRPNRPPRSKQIDDFDNAALALKGAVLSTAESWTRLNAGTGAPLVHRLSGGLDSSLVLAALNQVAGADAEIVCVHEYPEATPEGDERALARVAARHVGRELVEHESRPVDFDYERILSYPLPARPTHSEFSHANASLSEVLSARGARIVASGQGGDQVFHRRRSAEIAADAAFDRVGMARYLEIARDTAYLARIPIWDVFGRTLTSFARREPQFFNTAFTQAVLAPPDAIAAARAEWARHPWRTDLVHEPPARAQRAMHIGDLSYYFEVSEITRRFISAPIIASLPVVETVLAIPPYVMTAGGVDRSLARAAFADLLPEQILSRVHKGDTTRFHNRVLERQLAFVRSLLLEGELARRSLIDRAALESALKRDYIADGAIKGALMSAFMAELWLRRFLQRAPQPANPVQGEDAPAA